MEYERQEQHLMMKNGPVHGKRSSWKASLSIIIPVALTFTLFLTTFFLFFIPSMEEHLMAQKKGMLQKLTESAYGLVKGYQQAVERGEFSLETAQDLAASRIRGMRFGAEGRDYFWISDMHPRMVMHPYLPELEGRDLSDFTDKRGKNIFVDFVETVRKQGSGYLNYQWHFKDDRERSVPKLSFVKEFKPWGWIIGTGIYLEDVHAEIDRITSNLLKIFSGVLSVVLLLSLVVILKTIQEDRKRAESERALSESEKRYRSLFEESMDPIAITNSRGDIIEINHAGLELLGFTREEISGLNLRDLHLDREKGREFWEALTEKGQLRGWRVDLLNKKGDVLNCLFNVQAWKKEDGSIKGYQGIIHDITLQEKAQRALKESEEKYRLVVENAIDAIFVTQKEGIVFMNQTGKSALGYSEEDLDMMPLKDLIHHEDRKKVVERQLRRLKGEEIPDAPPFRVLTRDGEVRWVQLNSLRIEWEEEPALLNFARDITEQKNLEEQLRRAQKMEAIGTLAGGIAHDFNNILASIMGYAELLSFEMTEHTESRANLEKLLRSCHRAKDLVNQLVAFSRQRKEKERSIQMTPLLKECIKLLRSSLPPTIEIRQHITDKPENIKADPSEIQQLFMNLCTNAVQAMESEGGILEVILENSEIEPGAEDMLASKTGGLVLDPGTYVKLTVRDTGTGMNPETMERIFDPYFSTKERSDGTGLGLSIVHGIAKRLGGGVSVESASGEGSSFTVYFPRLEDRSHQDTDPAETLPKGHERILFVDDEEPVVDVGSKMLARLGYRVESATSVEDAINLLRLKPEEFDLVITDMAMPGMTAQDLAHNLLKIRPDIPIILCTGYTESVSLETGNEMKFNAVIRKPLTMRDLSFAIRRVLDVEDRGGS